MITLEIRGIDRVVSELLALAAQLGVGGGAIEMAWVFGGPSAPYAIYVHENLQAHHAAGTGARFLARPLEERSGQIAEWIAALVRGGLSMRQAIRAIGEELMGEMKRTTPVEFGPLRDSGHVVGPD